MSEFDRCLAAVLVHEGGYSDHPKDPGGPTMKGVTQRVYDDYRRRMLLPVRDVRVIADEELANIYRQSYWLMIKGDQLPVGVSYAVFDGAVNSGVKRSVIWLQKALGVVADGVCGPATVAAAQKVPGNELVSRICDQRLAFLKMLKTWPVFGNGWSRRVEDVRSIAATWANGLPTLAQPTPDTGCAKAVAADVKAPPPKAFADIATGLGAATVAITQAQEQLAPFAGVGFVAKVSAGLTAAGVVIALIGIGYRAWAKIKGDQIAAAVGSDA